MEKVCLQCGDIGYEDELVCCVKCKQSNEHTYCMGGDLFLRDMTQVLHSFVCQECRQYATTTDEYSSSSLHDSRTRDQESDEIISSNRFNTTPTTVLLQDHPDYYSFSHDHHPNHKGIKEEEQSSTSQPLIRPIWAGSLSVNWSSGDSVISRRVLEGVFGHVSTRSCHKVYAEASKFQPILQFDLLRRHPSVWPKSFRELGPSDDSIAVYFFPSLGDHHEEIYDRLIFDMIRDDLAMRTVVHTAELLVFPSIMLPSRFWRFQGKLYLWGVFRQKPTC